jgi:hypothetical protein
MKKYIVVVISLAIIPLQCCGQSQIEDKKFEKFVGKFSTKFFPINTKRMEKKFNVDNDNLNILRDEAIKYLNRTDSSIDYFFELYDYDEDIVKGYEKMECIPSAVCKYNSKKFISLITVEGKINSDTTLIYLYTLNYNGKIIDQCIIGEQFTRENDWISTVIENEYKFKIFKYSTNFNNYTNRNGILYLIDKEKPLSRVIIEDYEISNSGKIQKKKTSEPIYLKDSVIDYKLYRANSDDPMNEYDY